MRPVAICLGRTLGTPETQTARMTRKIDSARGREMSGRRFATAEPVFGNLRHHTRLNRFTRRGSVKVAGQWTLYGLVHTLEQLAPHGDAPYAP